MKIKILTNINSFKKYIIKYKRILSIGFLLLIFSNLIQICEPIIINGGFNVLKEDYIRPHLLTRAFEYLDINTRYETLIFFAILFFSVNLLRVPFIYLYRLLIMSASKKIECDLRNELFCHLQKLPLFYYHRQKTGDIIARLSDDIRCVDEFAQAGIALGNYLVLAPISIIYLFIIGRELLLYSLIPFVGISIFAYIFSKYLLKHMRIVQKHFGLLSTKVQQSLSGVRVTKAYVNEDSEIKNYKKINQENLKKNMIVHKIESWGRGSLGFLIGLSQLIFLGIGSSFIISGRITPGNFAAFYYQLNYLTWPILILGVSINLFQQASARMERINEIFLQSPDTVDSKKTDKHITSIEGKIVLKDLTFSWGENSEDVLRNITIEFPKGKSMGIIGNIGAGKSTLLNLIARLYHAPEGMIFIDNHPIEEIPLKILRSSIGYVTQEPFLFSGTIKENICLGIPGASQEILDRAAMIADIKKDVDGFPQGYETIVGERGVKLSGGQKQRIAIARAVIMQPKILLFDNALSQVDADTEREILKNLTNEMKNCTIIFVSNRMTSIKDTDLVAVLINGQIVETGAHRELLQLQGAYAAFFKREVMEEMLSTV